MSVREKTPKEKLDPSTGPGPFMTEMVVPFYAIHTSTEAKNGQVQGEEEEVAGDADVSDKA